MVALKVFFFGMLVAVTLAADASDKQDVEIVTEVTHVRQDGYDFAYQTSNGVYRQEEAKLITVGDHQGIGIKGSYSYIAPDGQHYQVDFTADDKGYNPVIRVVTPGSQ